MEVSSGLALAVAVVLVALGVVASRWLQRAEVRRLAWQAAEEAEIAAREEACLYGQYGGVFVRAPDVPEAPLLWAAPEVPPSPKDEVAVSASPPAGKGVCAMCTRPTTFRCKRCKSVKYCTFKCQIDHWRKGHRVECHPADIGATRDATPKTVVTGVELKDMLSDKPLNTVEASAEYSQFTGKSESVDCSRLSTSSKACKVHETAVREKLYRTHDQHAGLESELEQSNKQALDADNHESSRNVPCMSAVDKVSSTHSSAYCLSRYPSEREHNSPGSCAKPESSGVMPNNLSTEKKCARQQTSPKVAKHYPTELKVYLGQLKNLHFGTGSNIYCYTIILPDDYPNLSDTFCIQTLCRALQLREVGTASFWSMQHWQQLLCKCCSSVFGIYPTTYSVSFGRIPFTKLF